MYAALFLGVSVISLFKRVVYIIPQIPSTSAKGMIRNKYSNPGWFKKEKNMGNDTEEYLLEQMTGDRQIFLPLQNSFQGNYTEL